MDLEYIYNGVLVHAIMPILAIFFLKKTSWFTELKLPKRILCKKIIYDQSENSVFL